MAADVELAQDGAAPDQQGQQASGGPRAEAESIRVAAPDGPALLERGRHAITGHTDGSWTINRAGPLCERCASCGCGDAADPIHVPAFAVSMIQGGPSALPAPLRAMLGKVMGNGRS